MVDLDTEERVRNIVKSVMRDVDDLVADLGGDIPSPHGDIWRRIESASRAPEWVRESVREKAEELREGKS
jgi:hypothetical protein